jgi:transposase-like protein
MVTCPNCKVSNANHVVNVQDRKGGLRIRYYVCDACEWKYKTAEKIIQVKGWDDRKYKTVEGAEVIPEWAFCTK